MRNINLILPLIFICGCMTGGEHQASLHSSKEREMTLGIAQKEIKTGMSQADVAAALGSPNIVSKDSEGNESWIYDKIATEVSYSRESGGIAAAAGGLIESWALLLGGSGEYSRSTGAVSQTQRSLTVVIKFDEQGKVKTLSYHASKF